MLVIEDELLMRWSLAEALREAGHAVTEAGDAAAAVRLLAAGLQVDAILLDYAAVESINRSVLLTEIRRIAPSAPLVLMTPFLTPAVIRAAEGMGSTEVLTKPFDVYGVGPVIERACASRAAPPLTPLAG